MLHQKGRRESPPSFICSLSDYFEDVLDDIADELIAEEDRADEDVAAGMTCLSVADDFGREYPWLTRACAA